MTINRRLIGAFVVVGSLALIAPQIPASASTVASSKSLEKDLLASSYAKKAGFPKVAQKPSTTSVTGSETCPHGAEVVFENGSEKLALVSEVVACFTTKDAATLLDSVLATTSATSARAPKRLGASAIERSLRGTIYAIYWQRGSTVEAVSYATDVQAKSSSTSTTVAAPPITSAQQRVLSQAALEQDGLLG